MNVIEFVLVRPQRKITLVDIQIDGRTLIDLAREHEMPFAEREGHPNIAGKYRGVDAPSVCLPSRRLFGKPDDSLDWRAPKMTLLECECGVTGCWPLVCTISIAPKTVTWRDFEQPHRDNHSKAGWWDYAGFGPFVFDRAQYEAALAAVSAPPT